MVGKAYDRQWQMVKEYDRRWQMVKEYNTDADRW